MTAQQTETPGGRKLCLGSLAAGTLGASMALWAIKVDAVNNYRFGVQQAGEEGGQLLVLAALALAIVPMLAFVVPAGWDRFLRIVFWASVIATVIAAINAYGVKQGAVIDATKGAKDRYEQAQQDRAQARKDLAQAQAEAAAITELEPAAELQKQYDNAKERRDAEANDPKRGARCGENCRKAEAEMNALSPRIATARAKDIALDRAEKAQARLDAAKVESSDGPKEQTPMAKVLASWTGTTAEDAAGKIALVMAVMMIIISVSAGLIFDHSFQAIRKGLGFDHGDTPATPIKAPAPVRATAKRPLPIIVAAEERIGAFIGTLSKGTGEMTAGALYECFAEWWRQNAPGELLPSPIVLSRQLEAAGIEKAKRGGRVRYAASLELAAAVH